jgi:hypothetical protein
MMLPLPKQNIKKIFFPLFSTRQTFQKTSIPIAITSNPAARDTTYQSPFTGDQMITGLAPLSPNSSSSSTIPAAHLLSTSLRRQLKPLIWLTNKHFKQTKHYLKKKFITHQSTAIFPRISAAN